MARETTLITILPGLGGVEGQGSMLFYFEGSLNGRSVPTA